MIPILKNKSFLIFCLLFFPLTFFAQVENDCENIVAICTNAGSNGTVGGSGIDDFNGSIQSGCLGPGNAGGTAIESNSAWYTFTLAIDGEFGFDIAPANLNEDWDFGLYGPFSSTTGNCSSLGNPTAACNYSGDQGYTGVGINPSTGTQTGAYEAYVDGLAGETYILMINNFSASPTGFVLTFTGDIFDGHVPALDCSVVASINYCIGTNINLDATTPNAVTYEWDENGTPLSETGPILSGILASDTQYHVLAYNASGVLVGEQTFNVTASNPDAGTDNTIAFCSTDASLDLFTLLGGTPDIGGTWSPALTSGTGDFDPLVDTGGVYTYTVDGAGCPDATADITVTLDTAPNAGTDNTKAYCSTDAASDLFLELGTADLTGTWSPVLTSGTGFFDPLIDATGVYTYTVLGTGTCVDASATVTVSVDIAPEAGTNGSINYCSSDAATDLFLELGGSPDMGGTWSPSMASGSGVFDPAVDTANTYIYIVTGGGCPDATSEVVVTIDTAPDAGTDGAIDLCTDNTMVDLYDSLVGLPDMGGTWSPTLTSGTGDFDPLVDSAGTYTYTVTAIGVCIVDATATVIVTLNTAPEAGTNGTMAYCSSDAATDLFLNLNDTPDMGGTWSPALTSGTGMFDPLADSAGTYTYTVAGVGVCADDSATVTVTIDAAPNAGTDGTIDLCTDNAMVDLYDSLVGTPDMGGTWSPALISGTGNFDPLVDSAGTYTYTVTAIGTCIVDATATVIVTLNTAPEAGTNGTMAYCSTDTATDLFLDINGTPDLGGTWSPALTSGTGMFDPTVDVAGNYTYTVAGVGVCADDSATVTVTIDAAPNAGTDGTTEFCTSDTTVDLITFLGGTPDTTGTWSPALTSGTGMFDPLVDLTGIYTYTVSNGVCADATAIVDVTVYTAANAGTDNTTTLCSNSPIEDLYVLLGISDLGGTWSPALTSGTGDFNPSIDVAGVYTYTITGTGVCADDTATITVSIDAEPNAGTNNTVEFCSTDTTLDLFTILGGTPDATGVWSPALTSGTGDFNPSVDAGGIYTYTVSNGVCANATAEIDVTLYQAPNAGTNGTTGFCTNNNADDLINYLGGTPDTNGTWSPALTSGTGIFDPSVDLGGTYIYTVSGNGTCNDVFAAVDVTVDTAPDAGNDADTFFCMSEPSADLFTSLGGTPDTGGTWSPSMASGSGVFDPSIDAAGDYVYTVTGAGVCTDISATISVTLSEAPNITNVEISDFSDNNTITIDVEGTVSGTSFGIGDYEYSIGGVSFQSDNIFEGVAPGNYVLTVRDANGCLPNAFRNISIIGAPKFFTPNNDFENDTWHVINLSQDSLMNPNDGVSIFDRFGKLITILYANSDGWDGYYNGEALPSGDYWFSVLIKDVDGNPVLKRGHFSLIRR